MTDLDKKLEAAAASLQLKLKAVLDVTPTGVSSKDTILKAMGVDEDELALVMAVVAAKVADQTGRRDILKPGVIPFQYAIDLMSVALGLARLNFELTRTVGGVE